MKNDNVVFSAALLALWCFLSGAFACSSAQGSDLSAQGNDFAARNQAGLLDDYPITLHTPSEASARRAELIRYVWGEAGFPTSQPKVAPADPTISDPSGMSNVARAEAWHFDLSGSRGGRPVTIENSGYYFVPQRRVNHRVVLVHQGHDCTMNDNDSDHPYDDAGEGLWRTVNSLLAEGYAVAALYLPSFDPSTASCGCGCPLSHEELMTSVSTEGSPLRYFLEPVAMAINYLQNHEGYADFAMVGLSGGGWTTSVYAALDPRVTLSLSVAGSLPLYMQNGHESDDEQTWSPFYEIAGYPDLYVLGAFGIGRRQVQVFNRNDGCCFGPNQYDPTVSDRLADLTFDQAVHEYESRVAASLIELGSGAFRVELDESAPSHMISWNTVVGIILSELDNARRYVGTAPELDLFVRGANGHLLVSSRQGWQDTGLAIVGVPAVTSVATGEPGEVFFRDPTSDHLARAHLDASTGSTYTVDVLPGPRINTDPVAVSSETGRFDVVAVGGDYVPYHWWWDGQATQVEPMAVVGTARGQPALVAGQGRLDAFVRNAAGGIDHFSSAVANAWEQETVVDGAIRGVPAAVATADAVARVYFHTEDDSLEEATVDTSGAWSLRVLSTGDTGDRLSGSPGAAFANGRISIVMRTEEGALATFDLGRGSTSWQYANRGGSVIGSPTAHRAGGCALAGGDHGLWLFQKDRWVDRGGHLE